MSDEIKNDQVETDEQNSELTEKELEEASGGLSIVDDASGVTQAGREGKMEIYGWSHEVISPRDAASDSSEPESDFDSAKQGS